VGKYQILLSIDILLHFFFSSQDLLSQTREKQTATLSEVTWLGRTVPVKSEPVRVFLLNLQESNKEIESADEIDSKISIYESLLKQCIDAQQILRDSLQEDAVCILYIY
jgi:signal recognition particle subunit SRP68